MAEPLLPNSTATPAVAALAQRRQLQQPDAAWDLMPDPERPRRVALEGLAIGAPLTAAFIGVLLSEGHAFGLGVEADQTAVAGKAGAGQSGAAAQAARGAAGTPAGADADGAAWSEASATPGSVIGGASAPAPEAAGEGASPVAAEPLLAVPAAAQAALGEAPAAAAPAGNVSVTLLQLDLPEAPEAPVAPTPADPDEAIGRQMQGGAGDDVIEGTDRDDTLLGGDGDDLLLGLGGDDVLEGNAGDDRLFGGTGNDQLDGGDGADRLFGQDGNDDLQGGAGDDRLEGGAGADLLQGGSGDDTLVMDDATDVALEVQYGSDGGGDDVLVVEDSFVQQLPGSFSNATFMFAENFGQALPGGTEAYHQLLSRGIEHVTLHGATDFDVVGDSNANRLLGNIGDNQLHGMAGDDTLAGGAGNDLLDGGAGQDQLIGGAGDDVLRGGAGADELRGEAGDDVLRGGGGDDLLYGGAGRDTYLFHLNDSGIDSVFDHEGSNLLKVEGRGEQAMAARLEGNDLHLMADLSDFAVIRDYLGHEGAFAGLDLGTGVQALDDLLAAYLPAQAKSATGLAEARAAAPDWLSDYQGTASSTGPAAADPPAVVAEFPDPPMATADADASAAVAHGAVVATGTDDLFGHAAAS